jgi:hypothetical protein
VIGLSFFAILFFLLLVIVLIVIEVAFWMIIIGALAALALLLWAAGLHEIFLAFVATGAIVWAIVWGVYKLIRWDLGRIGSPVNTPTRNISWRIHDIMNGHFSINNSEKHLHETPPSDPEERFLWANRLGRYSRMDDDRESPESKDRG